MDRTSRKALLLVKDDVPKLMTSPVKQAVLSYELLKRYYIGKAFKIFFILEQINCFMSIKNTLLFFFLLIAFRANAQIVDTVIRNDSYTAYFNYRLHEPLYVVYKLYDAGGDCDRKAFHFKTGGLLYSATPADYKGSGYDEGHLADAKDFAFDCIKEEATFRFYNCVPQTPRLNRGIWKHFETEARTASQSDSLLIICGSIFGNRTIGPDNIAVPDYCWKIIYSLSKKELVRCMLFPNDDSDSYTDISVDSLKKRLNYTLPYPNFNDAF